MKKLIIKQIYYKKMQGHGAPCHKNNKNKRRRELVEVDSSIGIEKGSFTTSDNKYHYGVRTTASSEDVKKNNLYDIAGNLWKFTTERNETGTHYILRGGSFSDGGVPVCFRTYRIEENAYSFDGFRPVLYIK